jgi:hypothetical protein
MFNIFVAVNPCVKVSEVKELSFAVPDIGELSCPYHLRNCPGGPGEIIPGLSYRDKAFPLVCLIICQVLPSRLQDSYIPLLNL